MIAAKILILRMYPTAGAQHLNGIPGALPPYDGAHWRIFQAPDGVSETLGRGPTEEDAWLNAVRKLKSEPAHVKSPR